jgi:hypothetical protein
MTSLPVLEIALVSCLVALVLIFATLNWDVRSGKYARVLYSSVAVVSFWVAWDQIDAGHAYQAMISAFDLALCLYLLIRYWNGHPKRKRRVRRTRNSS